jgi:5-carboxymethyl-2-hydroxymuconate isomerase
MPHLSLEYSANVEFEIQPLLARLHEAMVATGAVNMKGLKSRAMLREDYRIADGHEGYKYVHLNILIRDGRPLETQQEIAQRTMAVLADTFGHYFADDYISLSVDIKEMKAGLALTKHNIPAGGVG